MGEHADQVPVDEVPARDCHPAAGHRPETPPPERLPSASAGTLRRGSARAASPSSTTPTLAMPCTSAVSRAAHRLVHARIEAQDGCRSRVLQDAYGGGALDHTDRQLIEVEPAGRLLAVHHDAGCRRGRTEARNQPVSSRSPGRRGDAAYDVEFLRGDALQPVRRGHLEELQADGTAGPSSPRRPPELMEQVNGENPPNVPRSPSSGRRAPHWPSCRPRITPSSAIRSRTPAPAGSGIHDSSSASRYRYERGRWGNRS